MTLKRLGWLYFLTVYPLRAAFEILTIQPLLVGQAGMVSLHFQGLNPATLRPVSGYALSIASANIYGLKELRYWEGQFNFRRRQIGGQWNLSGFGNDRYQEIHTGIHTGWRFNTLVTAGLGLEGYYLSIIHATPVKLAALSAGMHFYPQQNLQISWLLYNLTCSSLQTPHPVLPQYLIGGLLWQPRPRIELAAEFIQEICFPLSNRIGFRIELLPDLLATCGYQSQPARISAGLQYTRRGISVSLAWHNHLVLPPTLYFGCGYQY